jgi:hypothetical protein
MGIRPEPIGTYLVLSTMTYNLDNININKMKYVCMAALLGLVSINDVQASGIQKYFS